MLMRFRPTSALAATTCLCAFGLLLAPAALAESPTPTPLPVVASFSILGDMVQQVGGDLVSVTTLVKADSDAHGYQPSSADAKAVTGAKIVFVNGLGFDNWAEKLHKTAQSQAILTVASQGVMPRDISDDAAEQGHDDEHAHKTTHAHEHDAGGTDPHAWQDVGNGRIYAKNIAATLIAALPEQAETIKTRAAAYDAELQALDAEIRTAIAAIPAAQRIIITSHDAFGYFGAAYGVRFHAPYGLSTEAEPSAKDIARFIKQVRQTGSKTVFIENMSSPKLVRQLARDTGAKLGAALYSDALSAPNGKAASYTALFRHNLPLLTAAMQEIVAPAEKAAQ